MIKDKIARASRESKGHKGDRTRAIAATAMEANTAAGAMEANTAAGAAAYGAAATGYATVAATAAMAVAAPLNSCPPSIITGLLCIQVKRLTRCRHASAY